MIMCIQNLIKFCPIILKSKIQILKSIKGRNSVSNKRKMTLYNPNVDLVNDNVHTKFSLNLSIRSQYIEQKPNYAGMTDYDRERENDGQGKSSIAPR